MTTDKTGAEVDIRAEGRRYTISVGGRQVGLADFADDDAELAAAIARQGKVGGGVAGGCHHLAPFAVCAMF